MICFGAQRNDILCRWQCVAIAVAGCVRKQSMSAPQYAVKGGHRDCVRVLLNVPKLNLDCTGSRTAPPLHLAIAAGDLEIAQMLLTAGANINLHMFSSRQTPLHVAVICENEAAVRFLLEQKADVEGTAGTHLDSPLRVAAVEQRAAGGYYYWRPAQMPIQATASATPSRPCLLPCCAATRRW